MKMRVLLIALFSVALVSCNGCGDKKEITDTDVNRIQQDLIQESKKQHEKEIKEIAHFIKKKKWPMTETRTGLQYWIYENGTGKLAMENDIALVSYKITLLDDTPCYETTDATPKRIVVGHDNVETGLHEALQLMHVGDRARVILPSHLAFGFTGDSGKIPQNATVVYDLHLVSVN
jgi:FKBP-type peptidyl-prolyl cis-trans isomerase